MNIIPILQFVFQGFWTWLGFAVLLIIVFLGIGEILRAIRGKGIGTINIGLNGTLADLQKSQKNLELRQQGIVDSFDALRVRQDSVEYKAKRAEDTQ